MVIRKKQEGNLKCSASECSGIYMGIRAFLLIKMPQLQGILQVAASYLALAELIGVLQAVRRGKREATDLAHSITGCVHAHQQANRLIPTLSGFQSFMTSNKLLE